MPTARTIAISTLESRLDQCMASFPQIPFRLWGELRTALLPEEYAGGQRAGSTITSRPGTTNRLEEIRARVERGEETLRPGDREIEEDEAVIAASPVEEDSEGRKTMTGNGAKAARCRDEVPIDWQYSQMRGEGRSKIAEVSDQKYRAMMEKSEKTPAPRNDGPPLSTPEKIGLRLRYFRDRKGWTLGQLAKRSGVTRMGISLIERGKRDPGRETLQRLAWAFKFSIDELIGPQAA